MDFDDSPYHLSQRRLMVQNQLRYRGITDPNVLRVMEEIPRHLFIGPEKQPEAYLDQPVAIGFEQTISQPYIVALMTEKLQLTNQHNVLEIGTGCGYQTAILAKLAHRVFTIERIETLAQSAQHNLARLDITNVLYHTGDGTQPWPGPLPEKPQLPPRFDRILVAAAAGTIPQALLDQLEDPGKMVLPVGPPGDQRLLLIEKFQKRLTETMLCYCRFVKLVSE